MNRETKGDVIKNGKTKNGECEDAEGLMQEEEKEGDGEEEGLMESEKEEKRENGEKEGEEDGLMEMEKEEKEEEGLMEGALARYIVTRWSTPRIELVCEFLFLKKTNFILYS